MSFDGLRIALSSLDAQRRALEITGQNVANVATKGYSRQQIGLAANAGAVTPAIFAKATGIGQGVTADSIERARDEFLQVRAGQEHSLGSNLDEIKSTLDRVEQAFAEPSDNGVGSQLADFLAGWDDVANKPGDIAARSQLVERGNTLAAGLSQIDTTLVGISNNATEQLQASIVDVNATAARIAQLNDQIRIANADGLSPNDLMDQRDLAASELAASVGATLRPQTDGTLDVYIGGTAMVRGTTSNDLQVNVAPPPAAVSITWAKDGQPAAAAGQAGGLMTTVNDIVPRYRAAITSVATTIHDEVNNLHDPGYALDGATTGNSFFIFDATGALAVNPLIAADPSLVQVAAASGTAADGSVASKIAALTGGQSAYRDLVVKLGVESQTATRRSDIQSDITAQVDSASDATSGVDVDEEMTNMLMYQHAYDAAARLMTTIDSTLDTLINHTGLLG